LQAAITVNNGTLLIDGAESLKVGNIQLTSSGLLSLLADQDITIGQPGDTGYLATARGIKFPDGSILTSAAEAGGTGPAGPEGPEGPAGPIGPAGAKGDPGDPVTLVETSYDVSGGTFGATQPTFDGDPLFSGSYVKNGNYVFARIFVDFDNVTDFGDGQYFVTLPYPSKYDAVIRHGYLKRFSSGRRYQIVGYLDADSDVLRLWFAAGTGRDEIFQDGSPFKLSVEDTFHIAGSYFSTD
jgi:hypothetical protein